MVWIKRHSVGGGQGGYPGVQGHEGEADRGLERGSQHVGYRGWTEADLPHFPPVWGEAGHRQAKK